MFDFRYHALSLSAVFLALLIGLLLGVAIGDQGLVSSAEKNIRNSLRGDVREARAQAAELRRDVRERDRLAEDLYPLLVDGRLTGQRVAIVGLGGIDDRVIRDARNALRETGGRLVSVQVLREPVPTSAIPGGGPPGGLDDASARRFGIAVGSALVTGGKAARQQIKRSLLASSSGRPADGADAIILMRSARDRSGSADEATDGFEEGVVTGLADAAQSVVGVERVDSDTSQISFFKDHRLASVDNVDDLPGEAALVFALAGAKGAFGVKETADALLPNVGGGQ